MVRTSPQNGRQTLAEEDLPVDTARQEKKRKTATIMEEPGDGLHEEQRHGRGYSGEQTSLAFGSGWTALGCVEEFSTVQLVVITKKIDPTINLIFFCEVFADHEYYYSTYPLFFFHLLHSTPVSFLEFSLFNFDTCTYHHPIFEFFLS